MEIIAKGGYVFLLIICCSVIALTIIVERWWFYRRIEKEEKLGTVQIKQALKEQHTAPATSGKKQADNFLMEIYQAVLVARQNGESLATIKNDQIAALALRLEQYLYILTTIATIAPLMGLLGTVLGMIKTFHAASAGGLGDPHKLAEGISEALYNTAAGLIVTVPSVVAHNYLRIRAERLLQVSERRIREIIRLARGRGETFCR